MTPATDLLVDRLRAVGCVFAEDEARLLRDAAHDPDHLERLAVRRISGEPLEQVLGWSDFDGLRLIVRPGVFVPRTRTLLLARTAADLLPPGGGLLDLCGGVGAVAAWVARARADVTVHTSDLDPEAVACARENVPTGEHHVGDLFAPLPRSVLFDVVAVNAPYVPTDEIALMPPEARDHERHTALDGGTDGVAIHRRVAAEVGARLRPGGHVVIETGAHQVELTAGALRDAGLLTRPLTDDEIGGTVVVGSLPVE